MSSHCFIKVQCAHYPVRVLCQVLGVPASGYYAWHQAQQRKASRESPAWETALVNKCRYGILRLQVALRGKGYGPTR